MFKPLRMQHATLWVLSSDAPQAALMLATYGIFTPEKSQAWERDLPDTPGDRYMEIYAEARARLDKIIAHFDESLSRDDLLDIADKASDAPGLEELSSWNHWLGALWATASQCEEAQRRVLEAEERTRNQLNFLAHFQSLDVDLSWLVRPKRFVLTRIGTVAETNLPRLREALELSGYQLEIFDREAGRVYAAAIGPLERGGEIRGALDAAGWQEIVLDPELLAHPEEVRARLLRRLEALRAENAQCMADHAAKLGEVRERLREIQNGLTRAEPYVRISAETLRARGGLALITGWIAERDIPRMIQSLDTKLAGRYVLQQRPPHVAERDSVPSALRYPGWLGPFAYLVRNYGIPRYGEFDPTWLFAASFVLMFGMMFGDIGQGLVIALTGFALRGKARAFRSLLVAAGLSATLFGFVYGSLFGLKTLVEPLWISPLQDPARMLTLAIWWGVGFITVTLLLTIYNRLAAGEISRALFDAGGVAGMLLYLGAVAGVYKLAAQEPFGLLASLVCLAGLLAMLAWNWAHSGGGLAERVLTTVIEGFESLIGFFSNTLSFMRVAAFSINHVALSLAVLTIAENFGHGGHLLTLVIGNLIILVLEGAIVAIQVLRLQYYEGFSRFYSGSGRAFQPLVLQPPGASASRAEHRHSSLEGRTT